MLAINPPGHSTQLCFEFLIFLYILAARNSDLDKNNFVLQLWVVIEKSVKTFELLRQAFDMVQSVDANNYLDALISFFKGPNAFLDLRLLQCVGELIGVNANNELADTDQTVLILYLIGDVYAQITPSVLIYTSQVCKEKKLGLKLTEDHRTRR